jgi:WD40 repeat protein
MSAIAAPPLSPFKGLAAFADSDADAMFFFGREREREVVVANLLASRLTVLYGESGVGKSSLLAAGVVRALRAVAPGSAVTLVDTWSGELPDVAADVRDAPEAYLLLDQFEEYFLYHADTGDPGTLLHDLPELLRESNVNVLISLREDSLARLDALKARIPSVFANQIRLEHLDRTAAREAILGPVARWNELTGESIEVEPALVAGVLDEVAGEGRSRDRIEAPYLQLVLERIWETERETGSTVLRVRTLRALGGAATIVRDHLASALAALEVDEQDVAVKMFEHLVTPSGTKIAHDASDLAQYAGVPEDALRIVLAKLTRDRIVHSVDGSDRYEIFHDVLADPVREWRQERRLAQERAASRRRQRRLAAVAAISLVALAVVAALAVWALAERGSARTQARQARARELDATALQQLGIDPNASLRLALASARLEASAAAESVLRQALTTDRLRLVKHTGSAVIAVAASPRGDRFAAALVDGRVVVLDARNRRLIRTLPAVHAVAISFGRNGRTLVVALRNGIGAVWDIATRRRIHLPASAAAGRTPDGSLRLVPLQGQLAQEISHARNLVIAPDGSTMVAEVRGHPWLFDRNGTLLRELRVTAVRDVVFSPNGRLLAIASGDGFTTIWNARLASQVGTLTDARSGVDAVAFSPDGKLLASGGEDGAVRVWSVANGERKFFLFGHTNPVTTVAWSPDGHVLASGSSDRTVLLWRMRGIAGAGSLGATLAGSRGVVRALAFSPDGAQLLSGSDDATVRVWDARPDELLAVLGRASGPALTARWIGSSVVAEWPQVVKVFSAPARHVSLTLPAAHGDRLTSLGVSSHGAVIAAGAARGRITVWDGTTGHRLFVRKAGAAVSALAVSPAGTEVASADRDGFVRLWAAPGGRPVWTKRSRVSGLAFSPDGSELVLWGTRGAALRSAADGALLHRLTSPGGDRMAAFSPDGRVVATAGGDDQGRLWFVKTGNLYRILTGHTKPVTSIAFSPDGRLVATGSADSDVRVFSVAKGTRHVLQRGAFGQISAVGFDSTSRWVAAAAPVNVILWTAASGRQLFYVRGHTTRLTGVSFSPNRPTVLTSSRDGTVRTYTCQVCVDLSGLVHLAEVRLARTR